MKNTPKLTGFIALVAVIGLLLTACGGSAGDPGGTTYTVTFNVNGGNGTAPAAQTANAGSAIVLPSGSGLSKSNSTFGGWNTSAAGTGTNYIAGASYTPTASITLYAKWVAAAQNITREVTIAMWDSAGDGWDNGAALRINVDGTNRPANALLASGNGPDYYNFDVNAGDAVQIYWVSGGQYDTECAFAVYYSDDPPNPAFDPSLGTTDSSRVLVSKQYNNPWGAVGNGTLMGSFTGGEGTSRYTVDFDPNGGSGTVPSQTVDIGEPITLPSGSGLTKSGFNFDGWNTDPDGTGTNYNAGASYTPTASIILYAKWAITYTVDQVGGVDGTTTTTSITFTFSESIDSLGLTAAEITVSGAASKGAATLSGQGTTRTLSPINVDEAGLAAVSITKNGIDAAPQHVTVYKAGEYLPALTGITAAYTGTSTIYTTTPLNNLKTDLTVKAQYNNGNEITLSASEYTLSGTLTVGTSTITVSYEGETDTFDVAVTENPPSTPANVTATAVSSSSITVSWPAVSRASSYIVYRSTYSGGPYSEVGTPTDTSYTDTGLTAATTYYYRVAAVNTGGNSAQSSYVSAFTPPASHTPLTADIWDNGTITSGTSAQWYSFTATVGTSYYVWWNDSGQGNSTKTLDVRVSAYYGHDGTSIFTNYDSAYSSPRSVVYYGEDTTIYIKVEPYYSSNTGTFSVVYSTSNTRPDVAPVPAAPTGVTAAQITSSSITVSWSAVSGATSYVVYRSTSSGGTYSQVGTATGTSYTDTGLTANTYYYYRVAAVNAGGTGAQSGYISPRTLPSGMVIPPLSSTQLSANQFTDGNIASGTTEQWYSFNVTSGTTYYVWYDGNPNGSGNKTLNVSVSAYYSNGANISLNTGGSLTPGWRSAVTFTASSNDTIYIRASPASTGNTGTFAVGFSTTNARPGTPSGLTATALSSNSITVSWSAVSGATSYIVYRSTSSSGTTFSDQVGTSTGTSYTDTGLKANTTYYYRAAAVTSEGTGTQTILYAYATTPFPEGAQQLSSGTWTNDSFTSGTTEKWYWFPVTSGTTYYVWWNDQGQGTKTLDVKVSAYYSDGATAIIGDGGYSVNSGWLTPQSFSASKTGSVYIKVEPNNSGGTGTFAVAYRNSSSLPGATAAPNVTLTGATTAAISISWSEVPGAIAYYIYRVTDSAFGVDWASPTQLGSTTGTTYTNTGLSAASAYLYKVAAVNSDGTAMQSGEISASTLPTVTNATQINAGSWTDGSFSSYGSDQWYRFGVTSGTTYYVWWSDRGQGSGSTMDVRVSASYSNGASIFAGIDSGFSNPQTFTATSDGTVYVRVYPKTRGSDSGTFSVAFNTVNTRP